MENNENKSPDNEDKPLFNFNGFGNFILATLLNDYDVKSCNFLNEYGLVELVFTDKNGFDYRLEVRGIEKGT